MENQDHKLATSPSGQENHAPHLCHKCGWPFPNPHPSARHRRAHKKVCGKLEGYELSESEAADNSLHSAVSDDEQTPSPKGEKTTIKGLSSIGSYRSEDEAFCDAVTEFSDSGISPSMEERPEGVKNLSTNVTKIDDELLKANATEGISGCLNEARHATELNDPEFLENAVNHPEAATSLGAKLDGPIGDTNPDKSERQEINATGSVEAKQVPMSSVQPNDLKGIEEINAGDSYVDVVDASVEVSQSVASDTDEKASNNESYESKPQEAEGKNSEPLSLPSDLLGADKKVSSPVESKLLEADEQVTDSVPIEANLQHKERENPDSADLKLDLSEADGRVLDTVNVGREQEQLDMVEHDKQRISTQPSSLVQAPNTFLLGPEANFSNEKDGGSQIEFSDSSKTGEGREDVHVVSLAKDLPAIDNPELLLKDFKDHNKFKSSFPLDLGSSEVICPAEGDGVAAAQVSQSFVDNGRPDASISSAALNVSGDQVREEKVVSAEGKTDSSGLANFNVLKEPENSSKNSPPSGTAAKHSGMNIISSVQEEAKRTTKVDDPSMERTEASFALAEENKGGHTENERLADKETTLINTSCLSEANQTVVTLGGCGHEEHENSGMEHPTVAGVETEEKLARVSESDKTICPVGGHDDRAEVTHTVVHESRDDIFYEVPKDSTNSNDANALESTSATGLDSDVISDCVVKEPIGFLVNTDLTSHVVDNFHAGDGLESDTGIISSASQNEDNVNLIKQNDTVSAVDISMTSSRADSLDANWGSVSVLSTQSESTAVPDAEAADAGGLEKSECDLQKSTSGAEECDPDKSDVYEPPSFMTLVESGESANKKGAASEIETQLTSQQPKTEALKAGWFPSITNVVNESQGRKKNEEIIAKVTNWSTGKQHTPLKNLLGEAKSPNTKQVPAVNQKDETATKKNGVAVTTVNSILSSEAPTEQVAGKEASKEWNSPARYPVDIKKEKRKTKPYWVPFVCCSSVHQDA